MIVKLAFGADRLALDLRGLRVHPLSPSAPMAGEAADLAGAVLDRPIDRPPLEEAARGARSATVVVPDATRRAALPDVLPEVLRRLQTAGVDRNRTTVLVACGTHPPVGGEEIRALVGPVPDGVSVVEHDCRDTAMLVAVGELRPGLPLRLNRLAVESDVVVTVGTVSHHYFAGFGGGPKMLFPGVAGHEEIQANHALVLEASDGSSWRRHPGCEPGLLDGNPVAAEIQLAANLFPPTMALCLVSGRRGGVAAAAAGSWQAAFETAVDRVRSWFEVRRSGALDLMVASAGGPPTDSTLIQAHKAFDAACRFLEPGGELILVADLGGGPGSEAMQPFLDDPSPESVLRRLSERWVQYGHTTLRLVEKTSKFTVHLCSRLDQGLASRLGFSPVQDPSRVVQRWRDGRAGAEVGVMAEGTVFPRD